MIVIRDAAAMSHISDTLVQRRFKEICAGEEFDSDIHGFFIIVQAGDTVAEIEQESGYPLLANLHEVLEEHPHCYELVYIPSDGDYGIVIFVPKHISVDPYLLAYCSRHAVPAPELTEI